MGLHSRPRGKELISALTVLGEKLGYFVRPEYPVRDDVDSPPAVDVAWFVDATQKFPIMIFEVESGSSNTAPYNAMKALGTDRQVFEKPLFFFHLILGRATDSARIKTLEEQYGRLNYRVYQEGKRELTLLVNDILSQHRRVYPDADVREVVGALASDAWRGTVDLDEVLGHSEKLHLRRTLLSDYAWLLLKGHRVVRERYRRLLLAAYDEDVLPGAGDVAYAGYFGREWCYPVHLGPRGSGQKRPNEIRSKPANGEASRTSFLFSSFVPRRLTSLRGSCGSFAGRI